MTAIREDHAAAPPVRRWLVAVVEGPSCGAACELVEGKITIGSAAENALVLADRKVSRRHLELELLDTGPVVRDLDSKNGTFLDDERIHIVSLPAAGAALELGDSRIQILPLGAHATGDGAPIERSPVMPAPPASPVPPDTVEMDHMRRRSKKDPAP